MTKVSLVTKDVLISPDFETERKYVTVAYILFEASKRLSNSTFVKGSLTILTLPVQILYEERKLT